MEFRNLGSSGLRVSAIGLGGNNFGARIDPAAGRLVIHKALDLGVTLFDTADIYGIRGYGGPGASEMQLGEALGEHRKNIVLGTKFGMRMGDDAKKGGSRRYIMTAVEDSLRRLRTDWIDLYQFHQHDPKTPIEETLRTLDDLIHQGKVRYIACSNLKPWQVTEAYWTSRSLGLSSFIACEDEYSLLNRNAESELLPAMRANGMGLLPFQPLTGGLLTGKYHRGAKPEGARLSKQGPADGRSSFTLTERNLAITEKLIAFTHARGRTMVELAFSWLLCQPIVGSVIAGATKPEQLEQNVKAGGWKLSAEDLAEIDAITSAYGSFQGKPMPN